MIMFVTFWEKIKANVFNIVLVISDLMRYGDESVVVKSHDDGD